MPIIRSTEVNQQTAYDVQHWSSLVREESRSCALVRCEETSLHTQQVHTNLPLLCKSNTKRPVLYIISVLLVHFCPPDDGHNNARNMLS
jgi:hypothetical protein